MSRRSQAFVVATLACAACTGSDSDDARNVVELSSELAQVAVRYELAPPTLIIGGLKDSAEDEFNHSNGFLSAAALSDGGLAVIDETRLRLFGPDGSARAVLGKRGRGPGEVGGFSFVCVTRGDTVVAYDYQLRRISVTGPGGDSLAQFSANGIGAMAAEACFSDGTFMLRRLDDAPGGALGGIVSRVNTLGEPVAELGSFPQLTPVLRITTAATGDHFWVADPRTRDIRRFDASGQANLTLRLRETLRALTPDEVAQRSPEGAARSGAARTSPRVSSTEEVSPLYERVTFEGRDRLWIQLPQMDFREPSRWVRVDVSGTVHGMLELPGFTGGGMPPIIVQFLDRGVWLLHRDVDGAASFRFHQLITQSR